MTEAPRIRVTFRKALSDSNYGTEAAEISFDHEAEPGQEAEQGAALLQQARAHVHAELARSPSAQVHRALEPPRARPVPVGGPDETPAYDEDLPY
jgi:hypothetical protein